MSWEQSIAVLERLGLAKDLRHTTSKTSSVTTGWGVDWDDGLIARDMMQNFYDANRERLPEVTVTVNNGTVEVSAPARFNLELLFYLGSEKRPEDVGQYGEGFKVAALCLLRDHRVTPVMQCGSDVVCMRIADDPVPGTKLHPLVYDFFTGRKSDDGARLILPGTSRKLAREMETGLHHFLHEGNPLLGEKLWSAGESFSIYRSTTAAAGHVFYRSLKRGEIAEIPLVLVINKELKVIETKTKQDRDRKAFGEHLLQTFYKCFATNALRYNPAGQRAILEAATGCWERGHPLLSALASTARYGHGLLDPKAVLEVFGEHYFAKSQSRDVAQQLRYNEIERKWKDAGRRGLPAYFQAFGVVSAESYCKDLEERAKQEAHRTQSRPPTDAEGNSLQLLKEIVRVLAPDLIRFFDNRQTRYTMARTEVVLGELKARRHYRSFDVFLAEQVLASDFAEALAVFLHEHAHVLATTAAGDSPTHSPNCWRRRSATVAHWTSTRRTGRTVRAKVREERRSPDRQAETTALQGRLETLSEPDLRDLLARVPETVLKRLLDKLPG
jgi:hypothetical protein